MCKILLTCLLALSLTPCLSGEIMINSLGGKLSFSIVASTDSVSVEIEKNESMVFGTMTITNDGDDPFAVALSMGHNSPWELVSKFSDRDEEIMFYGIFTDNKPAVDDFDKHDVIFMTETIAHVNTFAKASDKKGVKGYDIGKGEQRSLFFRIDSPSTTVHIDEAYSFNVNATIISSVKISEKIGLGGGTIEIPNKIKLNIPPGAVKGTTEISVLKRNVELLSRGNGSAKDGPPVCAYEFFPSGLTFEIPVMVEMSYLDGVVPEGEEDNLRVFYWDGIEWRYIGGEVDKENKVVIAKLSHFSIYAILPAKEVLPVRPAEKIITPALRDGNNDQANFDGLAGKDVDISIYDITGRKVRTINALADGSFWDGEDGLDNIVESGVYIYQFELDGKMYSGTIAVAK
ncbi:MAG: hypothetical protein JW983_09110 [Elusimicrobia bacterium]|nr:hypothetical protein [Elusimicrobiota bacterium]